MRLDSTDRIAHVPILKIRSCALICKAHGNFTLQHVAGLLEVDEHCASEVIKALLARGWISPVQSSSASRLEAQCYQDVPTMWANFMLGAGIRKPAQRLANINLYVPRSFNIRHL